MKRVEDHALSCSKTTMVVHLNIKLHSVVPSGSLHAINKIVRAILIICFALFPVIHVLEKYAVNHIGKYCIPNTEYSSIGVE